MDDHELNHHLHAHSLSLVEAGEKDDRLVNKFCFGCYGTIHGPTYACITCRGELSQMVMHKSCAELPPQIHRNALHPHPLSVTYADVIVCDKCGSLSSFFINYKCMQCVFGLDFGCVLSLCNDDDDKLVLTHDALQERRQFETTIHHFCHNHPVTRSLFSSPTTVLGKEVVKRTWGEANCMACKKVLQQGTTIYTCIPCSFILHESCLNSMPKHVQSPFHARHVLLPRPILKNSSHECYACWKEIKGISFCCKKCDVNLHVSCAKYLTRAINHNSHPHHLLRHLGKSITTKISCHACSEEDRGDFLGCTECRFCIHVECLSLPTRVEHIRHMHPLVLVNCFTEDDAEEYYCDICETERNPEHHVYYCQECSYVAHVDCVVPELVEPAEEMFSNRQHLEENSDNKMEIDGIFVGNIKVIQEDTLHPHPLTLNDDVDAIFVCDGCGELARRISFCCGLCEFNVDIECVIAALQKDDMTKRGSGIKTTISHFSHNHPLTRCKITNLRLDSSCIACRQGVGGLMYICLFCRSMIHESCLEGMPMQLRTRFHPQHLLSFYNFPDGLTICDACGEEVTAILFGCVECHIWMHYSCAIYKTCEIKHDSHTHSLVHLGKTVFVNKSPECVVCGARCENTLLACIECGFYTHLECIRLPSVVKHMRHSHPLTLTNSVVEDDTGNYCCDVCEKERNPEHDVYHCKDCNFIAHIHCLINSEVELLEEIFEYLIPRPKKGTHRKTYIFVGAIIIIIIIIGVIFNKIGYPLF